MMSSYATQDTEKLLDGEYMSYTVMLKSRATDKALACVAELQIERESVVHGVKRLSLSLSTDHVDRTSSGPEVDRCLLRRFARSR